MIVTGGVPVNAVASGADLERALHYGNQGHRALAGIVEKQIG